MSVLNNARRALGLSERELAAEVGLARETLRHVLFDPESCKVSTLRSVCQTLQHDLLLEVVPMTEVRSELSIVAISCAMANSTDSSWKIHLFNFVDTFRNSKDQRLIILPPVAYLSLQLTALLHSVVNSLTAELGVTCPAWALKECFLPSPWFPSEMQSLKASAILESPLAFRRNNIFVLENFLKRA